MVPHLSTVGTTTKKCSRCGRNNHVDADCVARKHLDGTMLHIMGSMEDANDDADADDGNSDADGMGVGDTISSILAIIVQRLSQQ